MKNYILLFLFAHFLTTDAEPALNIAVQAHDYEKTHILLALMGKENDENRSISSLIKKAIEFKEQCAVSIISIDKPFNKQEVMQYQQQGIHYIIFINLNDRHSIQWHLCATDTGMVKKGQKIIKKNNGVRGIAYALADSMYEFLTNEPAFFSTKIAYARKIPVKNGTHYTHLYIADYDGSNAQPLVETATVNFAPRWNKDSERPLLFYSENTNTNTRMVAIDMHKKKIMASNFEGLNMLPAFCSDGSSVIYCATRGSGNCQLYHWANKSLKKITHNQGNNFSPVFGPGSLIFFSSDFETERPQIYSLNLMTNALERLTTDGYCVSPSYCAQKDLLAYSKMVQGVMQLFTYDRATKEHTQLTFDKAQKADCMWSACGNFLLCSVEDKSNRIAYFNVATQKYHFLTPEKDNCLYPALSGIYSSYPMILS